MLYHKFTIRKEMKIEKEFINDRFSNIDNDVNGLEFGIDVSSYANPNISWRKMSEIRTSLEKEKLKID